MRLTILNVAYPLAEVSPDAVGGAEQILSRLDAALVQSGHQSIVVACAGSRIAGELVATPAAGGTLDWSSCALVREHHREAVALAMRHWPIEVIHFHGVDFYEYLPRECDCPMLATLHLPASWYPEEIFQCRNRNLILNCVSEDQVRACPPSERPILMIPNGVPEKSAMPVHKERYALTLSRVCPEKGMHLALEAAKRADVPLKMAGRTFPYPDHERYFEVELQPRLDDERRFIGAVGGRDKQRLLAGASCLLVPSLVAETSSLAAMEALMVGTPVIAFPSGALRELVQDGRTGFLVRNVDEMAAAIRKVGQISPEECRAVARERFSLERMTERYLGTYAELTRRRIQPSLANAG